MNNTPVIEYFRATREQVLSGEKIPLEWEITEADRAMLDIVDVPLSGEYGVVVHEPRSYELKAFRKGRIVSDFLYIELLTPQVLSFGCDQQHLKEGEVAAINFRAQYALSWRVEAIYQESASAIPELIGKGVIEDGYAISAVQLQVSLQGACSLYLYTFNGEKSGRPEMIRLYAKPLMLELRMDKSVAMAGSILPIKWNCENARKLILQPGGIDVTGFKDYEIVTPNDADVTIELTAWGDFGQKITEDAKVYIARFNKIYTTDNADVQDPRFYLNWSATGISRVRVMPDNISFRESHSGYEIKGSSDPVSYSLVAETSGNEQIVENLTLNPSFLEFFKLDRGWAIVGIKTTVSWSAKNVTRIQIHVSSKAFREDLPSDSTMHSFQVFDNTDSVTLYLWGSVNLIKAEIQIPKFHAPVIDAIRLPSINFRMGLRWIASPSVPSANKLAARLAEPASTANTAGKLLPLLAGVLSTPSTWCLRLVNSLKLVPLKRNYRIAATSKMLSLIWKSLFDKLKHP